MTAKTDKNTDPKGVEQMVEGEFTSERKVTWSYTRKKQLKNPDGSTKYESEEVGIYITDLVPESEDTLAWALKMSDEVMSVAKTQVWNALDLDFSYDENGNPELDPEIPALPPAQAQQPVHAGGVRGTNAPAAPSVTPPNVSVAQQMGAAPTAEVGVYANEPAFCKHCGNKEFYDNRGDVDAKLESGIGKIGPDWKCKSCNKGVFRPGSFDYNQTK